MTGYARIHRQVLDHAAFRNRAEAHAFVDMILRAAWKPVRVRYKGQPIDLNRGQLAASVRDLAEAFDRDKGWVERVLKRLRDHRMIETVRGTASLIITICNYDKYQAANDESEAPEETLKKTAARQTQDTEQEREIREEEKKEIANAISPALRPEHVVEFWNVTAERLGLAVVRKLSPERRRKLNAMIRNYTIQDFTEAIGAIEKSPFLLGDSKGGWRADFDFLLQKSSFIKLLEGSYDRSARSQQSLC